MATAPTPRYETGRAMLVAGIRRHHRFADMQTTVPEQWRDFRALGHVPGQTGAAGYGVMCGTQAEGFEYMAGVEVEDFERLPRDMGRMRIPVQRYAVFTHEGHMSALADTWKAIWDDWLPISGITPANTPDFELYDEHFDPESGSGVVEIWFPVESPG